MSKSKSCGCGNASEQGPVKLIYACSGAADVGEIADRAARTVARAGGGKLQCANAIGAGLESYVEAAKGADKVLAIDGCINHCAANCLKKAGVTKFEHLVLNHIGLAKQASPPNDDNIAKAVTAAEKMLSAA
ncbi:putative zinc-binding protein [Rhizomicrobium electricum]|uniref:Zinc-binding protein n=1 Tax=Rhizomicrobium electricum TaxID=480070 RepID=A0ABN1E9G7_9PROT|nr:putative zinc-binding protein [Rhizomicrobium electricum]NIJ48001.1 putative metal-binding protein [Rhizomicrobium electricum]